MRDLVAAYGHGELRVPVLEGASFSIARGKVTAIRGRSGSGKTTLLGLLGGLDRPTAGQILVDGEDLALLSRRALAAYRRRHVGYVFQAFHLLPTLTADENVEAGVAPLRLGRRTTRSRVRAALDAVSMGAKAHRFPHQLSGGEQQRVAIARAMAKQPTVLLADEPTGNLDEEHAGDVLALLLEQAGPRTVVVVTHDDQVARRADHVLRVAGHQVHPER